jgi:hypothetical protein
MINSTYEGMDKDLSDLQSKLESNGYPSDKIARITKSTISKLYCGPTETESKPKDDRTEKDFTVVLPYSTGANRFRKKLQQLAAANTSCRINVVFTSFKLGNLFPNKCKLPVELCSDVVYQFKCHGCDARYIGETGRLFRSRILEHRQLSRKSHVLEHNLSCIKRTKYLQTSEFTIVSKNFNFTSKRLFCEALKIKKLKPNLNVQTDFAGLLRVFVHAPMDD